ncbi:hypothetical protein MOKP4_23720 [Mycobacterium avium subsp. hominissuis]|nr:hypothetical protein MAH_2621 [Mycobacterium avium subsp. hominissuis TH135]
MLSELQAPADASSGPGPGPLDSSAEWISGGNAIQIGAVTAGLSNYKVLQWLSKRPVRDRHGGRDPSPADSFRPL